MLAFSVELGEPGATKAIDVAGVPVLMLRGRDGVVRAFLNVCSHRGFRLSQRESSPGYAGEAVKVQQFQE